ncbi:hypothetical protein BpHYR1_027186, partial [Brachionus plicatilis]
MEKYKNLLWVLAGIHYMINKKKPTEVCFQIFFISQRFKVKMKSWYCNRALGRGLMAIYTSEPPTILQGFKKLNSHHNKEMESL